MSVIEGISSLDNGIHIANFFNNCEFVLCDGY